LWWRVFVRGRRGRGDGGGGVLLRVVYVEGGGQDYSLGRGEVNPTMDLQKILINHTLADFLVEGFAAPALHKLPPIDAWRLEYFMLTGVATNLTIRSANAAEMNLERAALTMLAI